MSRNALPPGFRGASTIPQSLGLPREGSEGGNNALKRSIRSSRGRGYGVPSARHPTVSGGRERFRFRGALRIAWFSQGLRSITRASLVAYCLAVVRTVIAAARRSLFLPTLDGVDDSPGA
jgi:hypothetical protein